MAAKPTPVPLKLPPLKFVRQKRKGNGWIAEVAVVPQELIHSGAVKVEEQNDWDLVQAVDRRVLTLAKESEGRR